MNSRQTDHLPSNGKAARGLVKGQPSMQAPPKRENYAVEVEKLTLLQRQRLDVAVMHLVQYLLSVSPVP